MNNLSRWLKQQRQAAGVVLIAIALTACNAPAKSQLSTTKILDVATPLIAPSSTSLVSVSQNTTSSQGHQQQAVQVIRNYYNAIARRDYQQAYSAWDRDGAASQQSFKQFKQGFANTKSTAVEVREPGEIEGAAGSSYIKIPVTITAVTKDGTQQRFRGNYVLRRVNDVPGSTLEQRKWHIYAANLTQVN
ncbi:MAG: hypothetical protein ABI417_06190 [Coleofasciculaceae cyanobacterium]